MFVKIDTAGEYELSIFKGMLRTIERCQSIIMIEWVDWEAAKAVSDEMVSDEPNLIF
jgi:hypothetical protein